MTSERDITMPAAAASEQPRIVVPPELEEVLLPGTDDDVIASYVTLSERAKTAKFGLFEQDYIIVDTETTGLSPSYDELIEIAAVRVNGSKIVDEFVTYVNPGRSIPTEITRLTGITNEMVADAPSPAEAVDRFTIFAGDTDLVAHNAPFDHAFIGHYASEDLSGSWIDSLELARIALPRLRSHGLDVLSRAFGTYQPSHDALDDVRALAEVWRVLLVALTDLPAGLLGYLASLRKDTPWTLRPIFSHLAAADGPEVSFNLKVERLKRVRLDHAKNREDAEGRSVRFPMKSEIAAGFTPEGLVGRMYEGYETRPEQVAMACEVTEAFATSTHRAIEAGTGVGKSIAYLYPAVLGAQRNNITIGVSTRTNALMDQLIFHELPLLSKALETAGPGDFGDAPRPLRYCALKGYDHYPCLRKLERFALEQPVGDDVLDAAALTMIATLYAFASQSSWGDLDAVPLFWRDLPRDEIVCTPNDCLHQRCPFFPQRCYLHGVRNRAKTADIVVTNHALLFRNLTMDNGILPPIRHWIVDEAHSIESEARRQLSPGITQSGIDHVIDRLTGSRGVLHAITRKTASLEGGDLMQGPIAKARSAASSLTVVSESFWSFVKDLAALGEESSYDLLDLWVSQPVRDSGPWGVVSSTGISLHHRLEDLTKAVRSVVSMGEQFANDIPAEMADLAGLASQLYDMQSALGVILDGGDPHYVYSAHINRRPGIKQEALEAGLIDVGEALVEALYPEVHSVIYTSATIATGASPNASERDPKPFAYFARAAGLDRLERGMWQALRLESGYDYAHNMAVYLPVDMPEPNTRTYLAQLERLIEDVHVAMGGSVLTLFTNRREMERVYDDLYDKLRRQGIETICQKRGVSAKRLRDQFLDDERLSLFALRSFWEGFDAPGDTLRCVIVTKLPFGRPTDPLSRERNLRDQQSWSHYVLPDAVIDFKQACGRLIRTSTDTGCLVLPDARLVTKRYGSAFLNALPPAQRTRGTIDEVVRDMRERFGK